MDATTNVQEETTSMCTQRKNRHPYHCISCDHQNTSIKRSRTTQQKRREEIDSLAFLHQTLHDKLQNSGVLLSSPFDTTSLISDAYGYIQELKDRIAQLSTPQVNSKEIDGEYHPWVHVEDIQEGIHKVEATCKKWPRVLVALLKSLDNLDLEVFDAKVSCTEDNVFCFEAHVIQKEFNYKTPEQIRTSILSMLLTKDASSVMAK